MECLVSAKQKCHALLLRSEAEAMMAARQSPEGQALLADGAKFIGRSRTLVVREREIISGDETAQKDWVTAV